MVSKLLQQDGGYPTTILRKAAMLFSSRKSETPNVTAYLSVVGHLQFSSGMDDPNIPEIPRVELVVRGFKGCRGPAYEATTPKYSRYPTKDP